MVTIHRLDNVYPPTWLNPDGPTGWGGTTAEPGDPWIDSETAIRPPEGQDPVNYIQQQRWSGDLFHRDLFIQKAIRNLAKALTNRGIISLNLPSTRVLAGESVIIGSIPVSESQLGYFLAASCVAGSSFQSLTGVTLEVVDQATSTVLDESDTGSGIWKVDDPFSNNLPPSLFPANTGGLIIRVTNGGAESVEVNALVVLTPNLIEPYTASSSPTVLRSPSPVSIGDLPISSIEGLQSLYEGSDLLLANTDPVPSWNDLSGHDNHLAQPTVGERPVFTAASFSVTFDGVDNTLEQAGDVVSRTVFAVVAGGTRAGGNKNVVLGNSTTNDFFLAIPTTAGSTPGGYSLEIDGVTAGSLTDTPPDDLTIVVGIQIGNKVLLRVNSRAGVGVGGVTSVFTWNVIGSGESLTSASFLDGSVALAGSFSRAITISEVNRLEGILAARFPVIDRADNAQVVILGSDLAIGDGATTPWTDEMTSELPTWDQVQYSDAGYDLIDLYDLASVAALSYSNSRARNIALIWDHQYMVGGATAATALSVLAQVTSRLRAAGMHVVVVDALPNSTVGYEVKRTEFNEDLAAGLNLYADSIIKLSEAAGIGEVADLGGANYSSDQLTDAGQLIAATAIIEHLSSL